MGVRFGRRGTQRRRPRDAFSQVAPLRDGRSRRAQTAAANPLVSCLLPAQVVHLHLAFGPLTARPHHLGVVPVAILITRLRLVANRDLEY